MAAAGMMGAYTYSLRGGVFCNAQTANVVLMAMAFGKAEWKADLYYLIPITAYISGAFVSEVLPSPIKKMGFLRWDTFLIGFETLVLFGVGLIPLWAPHQIVQVIINFICSMQYNTFRQAENVPMATTFCTNHIRQVGISIAKALRHRDFSPLKRGLKHIQMVLCFLAGGVVSTAACGIFGEKAIWLALIPLLINFVILVHADLSIEKDEMWKTPSGH
ncbi:MAG: DUF1275 domain-containing protein [Clostridiales bacterium]|nr:DUF1275 domain-containing protein [Clostridiales bacterium]